MEEISYNNKIIPLKTEKLKQVFKRVQSQMHDIQEYQASDKFEAGQQISNSLIDLHLYRAIPIVS